MTEKPAAVDRPIRGTGSLTVTLFGDHDAVSQAISAELERRGCRTHAVSVETGWLPSTTNAVVRLDTASGASALKALTESGESGVHVVATCASLAGAPDTERLQRLCEECGANHDVALLWHGPIPAVPVGPAMEAVDDDPPARHLAVAVVDEVTDQTHGSASPAFYTRSIAV